MRKEKNNIFSDIDWVLILIYLILVFFGLTNIYATSSTKNHLAIFDFSSRYGKQIIWIALSFPLIIFVLFFNSKFYERFASIFYLISLISLIGLFFFGKNINGATSWYNFGGMSLQPSEFMKTFTALALAKLLSDRQYNLKLIKNQIKAFIIIFIPALFILLQPDAGSALVYLTFFFVLNREGLTLNYTYIGIIAFVLFLSTIYFGVQTIIISAFLVITLFFTYLIYKGDKHFFRFNWVKLTLTYLIIGGFIFITNFIFNHIFKQHHRDRFDVLLGKKIDNENIGYNIHQSELAISSGGFLGKGWLQGERTQGNFVPEQDTDYIFSTVGEEWGFLGSSLVIILFLILIYRIIYLAETHKNKFGRIYGYGVASIFFFHVLVNIGMVIGLLPTVGIPLPFFSYGGSSLWGFTILLFIFIRLDAHKVYDW